MSGKIADRKHFLALAIVPQGVIGKIICNANPHTDTNALCRMAPDAPECIIQYSWNNVGLDLLETPHHAIDSVNVWRVPLPIIYDSEGTGEDFRDWIYPDIENDSYLPPLIQIELMDKAVKEIHGDTP